MRSRDGFSYNQRCFAVVFILLLIFLTSRGDEAVAFPRRSFVKSECTTQDIDACVACGGGMPRIRSSLLGSGEAVAVGDRLTRHPDYVRLEGAFRSLTGRLAEHDLPINAKSTSPVVGLPTRRFTSDSPHRM